MSRESPYRRLEKQYSALHQRLLFAEKVDSRIDGFVWRADLGFIDLRARVETAARMGYVTEIRVADGAVHCSFVKRSRA